MLKRPTIGEFRKRRRRAGKPKSLFCGDYSSWFCAKSGFLGRGIGAVDPVHFRAPLREYAIKGLQMGNSAVIGGPREFDHGRLKGVAIVENAAWPGERRLEWADENVTPDLSMCLDSCVGNLQNGCSEGQISDSDPRWDRSTRTPSAAGLSMRPRERDGFLSPRSVSGCESTPMVCPRGHSRRIVPRSPRRVCKSHQDS